MALYAILWWLFHQQMYKQLPQELCEWGKMNNQASELEAFFPDIQVSHGLKKCLPDDVILDRKIKESFLYQGSCT